MSFTFPSTFTRVLLCDELNEVWLGFCSAFWKAEDDAGMMGLVGDSDIHPYVSLTVNLAG